jgi:hypothetical protein
MIRITPDEITYEGIPCSMTAVGCARQERHMTLPGIPEGLQAGGYLPLKEGNTYIRKYLPVRRRRNFKRGERPHLEDLHFDGTAIALVYGHYIYLDHEYYYSFFYNEKDEVVALWELKDAS